MGKQHFSMKNWAADDQPREKLLGKGVAALSTNELVAILLRSGVDGESAIDLSRRILADNNNDLNLLANCGVRDLMNKYHGVGIAKATSIIAAIELGRRRPPESWVNSRVLRSSVDAFHYIFPFLCDLQHEELWAIFLSHSRRLKGSECLSSGGMDRTVMDVRLLFRCALDMKASSVIIAHNHPDGNIQPSVQDKLMTKKIAEAGALLDIALCDHLIIAGDSYFSFLDEDLLNTPSVSH